MGVRLIYNHIAHHASHSGYDQLAKYVRAKPYREGALFKLATRIPEKHLKKHAAWHTTWYWGKAMPREIAICTRMMIPTRTLYHFFYAENDIRISSVWKRRFNNKVIASFHQPPEFLDSHVEDKSYIRGLDGAVVMAESQIPYMSQFLPREKIFCVPHGVDIDYWHPDPAVERWPEPTFVFVGFWLRDIEMAQETIRAVAARGIKARFRIVTFPDRREHFDDLPQTEVLCEIPDAQLLEEYRKAHALFLPLNLSTANNAILEAMACGTGIITTATGGIPEYVDEHSSLLVPSKDVDAAVAAIQRVCEDRELVTKLGEGARRRAEHFSWVRMGELQNQVYDRVLKGK